MVTKQVVTGLTNPASTAPPRRPAGRGSRRPITCGDSTCQASTSMLAAAGKLPSVFGANSPIRSLNPVASPNISATDWSIATADGVPCVGPCVSRRCTLGNHRGDVERPRHRLLPSPHAASSVELRRSTPPNTPGRVREDAGRAVDGRAVSTRVRQQRPIGLDVPRSLPRIARMFEAASGWSVSCIPRLGSTSTRRAAATRRPTLRV